MAGVPYFHLRKELHECVPELSLSVVGKEHVIFSRLLYRAKSQHRREKSFQKLVRASKDIKKYLMHTPDEQVQNIIKLLSRKPAPSDDQHVIKLALHLLNCASFAAATLKHLEDTFGEVLQQLARRLFIPVNVLFVASLSRFWFCLRYHLLHVIKIYDILRPYLARNTGEQLPQAHVHLPQCYHGYLAGMHELTPLTALVTITPPPAVSITPSPAVSIAPPPAVSIAPPPAVSIAPIPKGALNHPVPKGAMDPSALSKAALPTLSNVMDFGVPVQPSVEQLISRQKDFSNAVMPRAVSRNDCLVRATSYEHQMREDHVTKSDEHVTTTDDHVTTNDEHVTRGEHMPKDKLAFWNTWEKGQECSYTAKEDPAVQPDRRNRRLKKVLARTIRKWESAHGTRAACHRRTPYGIRVIGSSRLKCTRKNSNLVYKRK